MYNGELKRQFIRDYTKSLHTAEVARVIFDAFEPYEEEWGADLCTRSTEELQSAIDNILGLRVRSKWMSVIILREYAKWCLLQKAPGACDGIMHVNTIGLDKVRKQMVSGPLHLQRYFDEVFDSEHEETIDIVHRCYLWMAYGGISEEEALAVSASDVNFDTLRIVRGETEAPIYREAIAAFRLAIGLADFVYKHPNYEKSIRRDRIPGDTIVRGIKANIQLMTMRSTLSRRLTEAVKKGRTELQLSFYRVWLSGVFYRMYEMERAGFPPNFSEVAVKEMAGKEYSLSGKDNVVQKRNRKARDYMEDYQRWKLAFSI